ncbi:ribonuclease H-like domain-containing protein [Obelidium mucronatum]|nr:ribonuclease H-like domain-containing protein [Obelidium mucronatum]
MTSAAENQGIRNPIVSALREELESLGLSPKGQLKQLQKRLRNFKKNRDDATAVSLSDVEDEALDLELSGLSLSENGKRKRQPFEYYLVFDVEATCKEDNTGWRHEIIEFPVVVIHSKTFSVAAEFRSFVKPVINPILTEFCTNLTGITQEQVDAAPTFPKVLKNFEAFLSTLQVKHSKMAFVTDGPWDIRDFVRNQCVYTGMRCPQYFDRGWIDLRRVFTKFYGRKDGKRANLAGMLSLLGMEFEGREHSGIDDTRNIARIVLRLMDEGVVFESSATELRK